ncbi:MAG: hypothetical protein P8I99_13000 [Acidimicrobiales bacterium]|nr:hypothetical protein [Acidimicrobiales bacterium]MDG1878317.1 hypothetical protein [Acidimicrobiales bacterium]
MDAVVVGDSTGSFLKTSAECSGADARSIGGIVDDNRAKVGADAVVVCDVDPDTSKVGIPAKPVGGSSADQNLEQPDD